MNCNTNHVEYKANLNHIKIQHRLHPLRSNNLQKLYIFIKGHILYYYVEHNSIIFCFDLKNKQKVEVLHLLQVTNTATD